MEITYRIVDKNKADVSVTGDVPKELFERFAFIGMHFKTGNTTLRITDVLWELKPGNVDAIVWLKTEIAEW
ncbi:hypothetical protein [Pseudomonas sp. nanlin1]|uniref:hypothetical protein n=1 Tax=Pseudomonas sp. nanlin1 TaxID=3040605 RepID=UPI003890826D